eukprot:759713-Hanusia_phi.AAC.2
MPHPPHAPSDVVSCLRDWTSSRRNAERFEKRNGNRKTETVYIIIIFIVVISSVKRDSREEISNPKQIKELGGKKYPLSFQFAPMR